MPPIVTTDVDANLLPRDVADPIFERSTDASAVQRAAQREELSDSGRAIPIITGEPTGSWVGEGERKPVADAGITSRLMDPKKLTVIVLYSTEVARRNPANLSTRMQDKVGGAFGRSFDRAAITAAAGPFTTGLDASSQTVALGTAATADGGIDADVVQLMRLVAQAGFAVDGWIADPTLEVELLDARSTDGRPTYDPNGGAGNVPRLKGRPIVYGKGVKRTAGGGAAVPVLIGGEWAQAAWGQVGSIEYAVSEEASLEIEDGNGGTRVVHTFQDNLTAMRAETWYGFVVGDADAFAYATPPAPPAPEG